MLIAHISDAHICDPGKKTYGYAPMAENLAWVIADINAQLLPPDLVLLSGDVTNDFTVEQTEHAAQILSALNCPYYIVPGNHDDREAIWQVFGGAACPARAGGFINYVIEGQPLRIIGIDSLQTGASAGAFTEVHAEWLRAALAAGGDQPTLLFMHHPPIKVGVPETDEDIFQGADLLGDIVQDYPNIERILCGHIHLTTHSAWRGTIVATAPSLGMQLRLDLTQENPSQFMLVPPAYLLHHWLPRGQLISHSVQVNNPEGPFPFEEAE